MNDLMHPDWFEDWFNSQFRRQSYTPPIIIQRLNLKKDQVYKAMHSGELGAMKTSGRWFVPKPALRKWLIRCYTLNLPEKK